MKSWMAFGVVVLGIAAWGWPRSSPVVRAEQGNTRVELVPPGQKQVGNPGEKGATYYALEAQTTRLTTRFRDGHTAVADRGLIGEVRTTVRDQAGNDRAQLRLNRIDAGHDIVNYEPTAGAPFQALSDPQGRMVSDPNNPLADANGYVRAPEDDLATQMTQLVMAQRGFQASVQVTKDAQDTYRAAFEIGRN